MIKCLVELVAINFIYIWKIIKQRKSKGSSIYKKNYMLPESLGYGAIIISDDLVGTDEIQYDVGVTVVIVGSRMV